MTKKRITTQRIARLDYITDGTPMNTVVVATLHDGTQLDLSSTIQALEQEEGSPVVTVRIVGTAPIRDHAVAVSV